LKAENRENRDASRNRHTGALREVPALQSPADEPAQPATRFRTYLREEGGSMNRIIIVPCTIGDATAFVRQHHRHRRRVTGALFAVAIAEGLEVRGVGIAGRPVARGLQDGWTVEIIRVCTDGARNACSMIYGALRRAAIALGYKRVITYTLATEPGASLKASGFRIVADVRGRSWNCPTRPRVDREPHQAKLRWEAQP
jgi:hypothetical protein